MIRVINRCFIFKKKVGKNLTDEIMIREMKSSDSKPILDIYKKGIDTKLATFETDIPSWVEFEMNHLPHSRFVAELNGEVVGWVALSSVSKREAYKGVAEVSVYVDTEHLGEGIGSLLMERVIESSESNGLWTLFSSVLPGNKASIKLHKRYGFRVIGRREKISRIDNYWSDTVILERRSRRTGI
jgi:L-amino acid N-acyltransferase YncA